MTNPDADELEEERSLRERAKAKVLAVLAWVRAEVGQATEEIAPQLSSALSGVSIPSRAIKPLALAGVLLFAAVALPAAPLGNDATTGVETTEEPVVGTTYDAPEDGEYRQVVESALGTSEADAPEPPSEVRASAGTQTMSVATTIVDGEPAIVLEDDRTHSGRWVSVPTSWFKEELGEVPSAAHIDHDSGDTYAAPLNVRGESATFYVKEFSTNTVTFSGEVVLNGDQAGDGTQYQYELNSTSGIDDPSINLTGVVNTADVSETGVDAGSKSIDVLGTAEPTGPASGEPQVSVTHENPVIKGISGTIPSSAPDATYSKTDDGSQIIQGTGDTDVTMTLKRNGNVIDSQTRSAYYDDVRDAYVVEPGNYDLSGSFSAGDTYEITQDSSGTWYYESDPTIMAPSTGYDYTTTVATSSGATASLSENGTQQIDLAAGDTITEISGTDVGISSYEINYTAKTETVDPVVELNGETTSYSGTLAHGETVSLSANNSSLVEGTNRVNISTNSPTSGPASLVGFEYSHSAEETVSATVSETTWSQSTNVSYTWADSRSNATATVPMNDRVVGVRNVEVRTNGSTWSSVSSSNYSLDGTDLVVDLGDVASGETTEVRATGSKVRVTDGSITVLEPTTGSDQLDTRLEVNSAGPNFALSVDETIYSDRIHYAKNATWGETTGESTISSSGEQSLTLPSATAGGEATVRTWPVEVAPATGSVTVPEVKGDRTEPGFTVRGDGNSEVDYTYVDAADATAYVLYSETNGIARDQGLASSPITLSDDNSDETLFFLVDDGGASGSGSGTSASAGVAPMEAAGSGFTALQALIPDTRLLLLGLIGLAAGVVAVRRSGVVDEGTRGAEAVDVGQEVATTAGGLLERLLENEIVVGAIVLAGGAWVLSSGVLPPDATLIVSLSAVPVALFLVLQQFDRFDFRIWLGSTALVGVFGINALAPSLAATIAEETGVLIVGGALLLGWRAVSAFRAEAETPDEVTRVELQTEDDD